MEVGRVELPRHFWHRGLSSACAAISPHLHTLSYITPLISPHQFRLRLPVRIPSASRFLLQRLNHYTLIPPPSQLLSLFHLHSLKPHSSQSPTHPFMLRQINNISATRTAILIFAFVKTWTLFLLFLTKYIHIIIP